MSRPAKNQTPSNQNKSNRNGDKRSLHISSFAALVAAVAAGFNGWQAWVASDTEKRQLRAYIGLTPGGLDYFGEGLSQKFTIIRKNHGSTPAYDITVPAIFLAITPVGTAFPSFKTVEQPDQLKKATLFPGAELRFEIIGAPKLTSEQIKDVNDGKSEFLYSGIIKYSDVFGEKHFTKFCYRFKGIILTSTQADVCLENNDSD